jgi:asparagine synthase (glutamine-hydrolysing)
MCGICGVATTNDSPVPLELIQSMARSMRHRGPDDEGYHTEPGLGLGFQRLAIIDLSGGHQPMSTEDGRLQLIFNGEIYNFQALRKSLEATGRHRFRTNSDTEVILHLYQEYGENCVDHMRGMFALALWDSATKKLFLARDRFGKKPLVYASLPGLFLFSSELRALLKHPAVGKDIDYNALDLYLTYQYIPSPHTVFRQIRKLPPAHCLTWHKGEISIRRYWEPRFLPKTSLSFKDATAQFMDKLREATQLRMISDVPLGAFLSGGKDSSVIVGLMSELSSRPVKTFSIGFEEESFSELPYARIVADRFHCDHHEFVVKPDAVDVLPKLVWHYGEPYADSSALPSYYLAKMTREHVTVALNGDGGDETLCGYRRYQAMKFLRLWQQLPSSVRKLSYKMVEGVADSPPPHSISQNIKRLLQLGVTELSTAYLNAICYFREDQKQDLYSESMRHEVAGQSAPEYINDVLAKGALFPDIDCYLYADMLTYLPECLMTKVDIASMANSLEARSPFLDHEVVELVASFPPSWKLRGLNHTKYILDVATKGWMPDEILNRKKWGFAIPIGRWFKGELRGFLESTLLSDKALSRGIFRPEAIRDLVKRSASFQTDFGYQLWTLLMLELWFHVYIDSSAALD